MVGTQKIMVSIKQVLKSKRSKNAADERIGSTLISSKCSPEVQFKIQLCLKSTRRDIRNLRSIAKGDKS